MGLKIRAQTEAIIVRGAEYTRSNSTVKSRKFDFVVGKRPIEALTFIGARQRQDFSHKFTHKLSWIFLCSKLNLYEDWSVFGEWPRVHFMVETHFVRPGHGMFPTLSASWL